MMHSSGIVSPLVLLGGWGPDAKDEYAHIPSPPLILDFSIKNTVLVNASVIRRVHWTAVRHGEKHQGIGFQMR